MSPQPVVGRPVPRVDGWEKVSGSAEYLTDMALPDMAHAAVVRSPYPRARARDIEISAALAAPGVLAVLTPADVADLPPVRIFADSPPVQRILTDIPQFSGDAVAAVVATTEVGARRGALAVEVDYEPLPAVLSAAEARDGAVKLHPAAPGNRAGPPINISRGDVEAALAGCAHAFRDSYSTQRQCAQTIEPLACICDWSGDHLDVWTHLDSMFHFRDALAEALAIDAERVRIHPPQALGASFGLKNSLIASLEPLAALCSRKVGRPVKLALSPEESMSATVTRHPARIELVTGVDADGILVTRSADVLLDSGAYGWGYVVALSMVGKWASLYRTEHLRFSATSVYTNHVPGAPTGQSARHRSTSPWSPSSTTSPARSRSIRSSCDAETSRGWATRSASAPQSAPSAPRPAWTGEPKLLAGSRRLRPDRRRRRAICWVEATGAAWRWACTTPV